MFRAIPLDLFTKEVKVVSRSPLKDQK